nr:peptide-N(4)-(N-acetyl-beta-glucosaminyl)asparagine amidase [Ciona intestinalis]XP_026690236.1 peptide-N(4)-(N-acetyl-beta-glucosaminyl)asparagine amidase [Ciona intestinalis]|eukprot:XP_002122689.1 peptide-N(4)-(N-acetyl-beta-glucosaminyl)asparagine amidase [Ciona intestinalis]
MDSEGVQALIRNKEDDFKIVLNTLYKIARNILQNPLEEKFRSIKIVSKAFQEKILPFDGAIQCLLEMGFKEDGDRFTLFSETKLDDLEEIYKQLMNAEKVTLKKNLSPSLKKSQEEILPRLKSHLRHTAMYENKSLQQKARAVIPIVELNTRTEKRLREETNQEFSNYQYCFLLELLHWFKYEFFTWTNQPPCTSCPESEKYSIGMLPPSDEDLLWGASRVEGYTCSNCNKILRFPRYNHPEKLLETRTGRCGEWANCFTLICKSMAYDARHVLDWTDHVWTEVFIVSMDRWLHCDSCENVCDKPLMYEQGWNKKLSLIVAADHEHIVDVTRRYTRDVNAVEIRRNKMFDSDWLKSTIRELNETTRLSMTQARKEKLRNRQLNEEKELSSVKTETGGEYEGRTSGSLAWRLARGETDKVKDGKSKMETCEVIRPSEDEIKSGMLTLEYSSSLDKYTRITDNNKSYDGWKSLVYCHQDVMKKVEQDWKQTYICRKEDTSVGYISWRVELPNTCLLTHVELCVKDSVFEQGHVSWLLTTDKTTHIVKSGTTEKIDLTKSKSQFFSIHAFLRGENWQHAQLFREPLNTSEISFNVKVLWKQK